MLFRSVLMGFLLPPFGLVTFALVGLFLSRRHDLLRRRRQSM